MNTALLILGTVALAVLFVTVVERVAARAREISDAGGDTAVGWIIRCTACDAWRPATEAGIVRFGAASVGKRTPTRCGACGRLCLAAIERGPGPAGKRRIDARTNPAIWPETLANA